MSVTLRTLVPGTIVRGVQLYSIAIDVYSISKRSRSFQLDSDVVVRPRSITIFPLLI